MEKRKVVLVGTGFVGMSFAYSLFNQGGANELVLIDVLKEKAQGEALDLAQGIAYAPSKMNIKYGEYNQKDIYIGVPAIVTAKGVREVLELPLSEKDQEKFDNSANILRETIEGLDL